MDTKSFADLFDAMQRQIGSVVIGQDELLTGALAALFAQGHVLVEGAPGLGKTLALRALASVAGCGFKRIQFTPDLMPSDITGSSVLDRATSTFTFVPGPLFAQLVLADEINRAPAKTQSALLEAMQDRQITVDGVSRKLEAPFMVLATQNPIESQGTYPLPEAQLDRFLMKLLVQNPSRDAETTIVKNHAAGFDPADLSTLRSIATATQVVEMQACAARVRVGDEIVAYMVDLVRRTREDRAIELGASPRASLALLRVSQVMAASQGRDFVTPDDVKPLAATVLRHRILLHPDAQIQGTTPDDRIADIVRATPVPRVSS
ncbi:MAG: MoxR family ATPase [Myxococcales bacterium]|nr:MoxR family ATPase [Myxococcales bacterium]